MPAIHSVQALHAMQRQAQPRGDTTKRTTHVWTGRIHATLMQATSEPHGMQHRRDCRNWKPMAFLSPNGLRLSAIVKSCQGRMNNFRTWRSSICPMLCSTSRLKKLASSGYCRIHSMHESARGCHSKRHLDGVIRCRDDKYCKLHITTIVGPYNMFCIGENPTHDRRFDEDMKDNVSARKTSSTRSSARITN